MSNPFSEPLQIAPTTNEPILVEINARMVPLVIRALDRYKYPQRWATNGDFISGVNQINQLQGALLTGTQEIVESVDRLYRLVDTIYNGRQYIAPSSDPADITPALPLVPPNDIGQAPGLRRQHLDAQGELPDGFMGLFPRPATTTDLVKALRQGSESEGENLLSKLDLLGDAGDIGGIFNVVRSTIADGLEVGAEGGILAVLVASTMAQAAMAGLQAAQIDTLIAGIDRLVEQVGVAAAPSVEDTIAGELAAIRDNTTP